jgi:hypothetical protein
MPMFGSPELERQFDASETMSRRVFIIDQAVRDLERTVQSTQVSSESAPVKSEIERLRQLRQEEAAALAAEMVPDGVFDHEQYLRGLEKSQQERQAELARREIINSQEFDNRAAA